MGTQQQDIRILSEKHSKLETLINRVNCETLKAKHRKQNARKATGVDRMTKVEYGKNTYKRESRGVGVGIDLDI